MNFKHKIFLAIFLGISVTTLLLLVIIFNLYKEKETQSYIEKYKQSLHLAQNAITHFEKESEILGKNAVSYLDVVNNHGGIKNKDTVERLKEQLEVSMIAITNMEGKFIYNTFKNPDKLKFSLFDLCPMYKNLLNQDLVVITPIMPSYPSMVPHKYFMKKSSNGELILEVGIQATFINNLLKKLFESDKAILSLELLTPQNIPLAKMSKGPKVEIDVGTNNIIQLKEGKDNFYIDDDKLFLTSRLWADIANCCECKIKNIDDGRGNYFYKVRSIISLTPVKEMINSFFKQLILIFIIILFISLLLASKLTRILISGLQDLNLAINEIIKNRSMNKRVKVKGKDEVASIYSNFNHMLSEIELITNEKVKLEIEKAKREELIEFTNQVGHDIRGPLAALKFFAPDLKELPEEKRVMIFKVINRIHDIANTILEKRRQLLAKNSGQKLVDEFRSIQLASRIDSIVAEKRMQLRHENNIQIEFNITHQHLGIFAKLNPTELKRIFSNIINNSIDALEGTGKISISLFTDNSMAIIRIQDDGKGIPKEILEKIQDGGVSYGKELGNGLGLSHAKKFLSYWGGILNISSEEGVGTIVDIKIPLTQVPNWFIETIHINKGDTIIIIDDDPMIHDTWKKKFLDLPYTKLINEILNFYDLKTAQQWLDENLNRPVLILCDFDFKGDKKNGINFLVSNSLNEKSIIVTSNDEDLSVIQSCEDNNLKLIGKSFVFTINVNFLEKKVIEDK